MSRTPALRGREARNPPRRTDRPPPRPAAGAPARRRRGRIRCGRCGGRRGPVVWTARPPPPPSPVGRPGPRRARAGRWRPGRRRPPDRGSPSWARGCPRTGHREARTLNRPRNSSSETGSSRGDAAPAFGSGSGRKRSWSTPWGTTNTRPVGAHSSPRRSAVRPLTHTMASAWRAATRMARRNTTTLPRSCHSGWSRNVRS